MPCLQHGAVQGGAASTTSSHASCSDTKQGAVGERALSGWR